MLTVIYISVCLSLVFFKVPQKPREEEAVGSCPEEEGFCCLCPVSALQRTLQTGGL